MQRNVLNFLISLLRELLANYFGINSVAERDNDTDTALSRVLNYIANKTRLRYKRALSVLVFS
jgi:hypothetical protein